VRVIGDNGQQMGVLPLTEAISLARTRGVDLVEVAPNATPPVCRLVDFGKYKYEQEKRQKESRKHQHASRVKEIQLSATIDPHDFQTKLGHAIDFLCDEMKVKASLRFRGREMAHTEFGFQVVKRFLQDIAPWGHPDFEPKLTGRSINVMISPLPRNKRAKHPEEGAVAPEAPGGASHGPLVDVAPPPSPSQASQADAGNGQPSGQRQGSFSNNPFEGLQIGPGGG
jgi:translation initiation factor IF-3